MKNKKENKMTRAFKKMEILTSYEKWKTFRLHLQTFFQINVFSASRAQKFMQLPPKLRSELLRLVVSEFYIIH